MADHGDNVEQSKADDLMTFEEAMGVLEAGLSYDEAAEEVEDITLWAKVQYEEGTSGPLESIEGVLIDGDDSLTIINPETGVATIIGDRFIVRVDIEQIDVESSDEGDKEAVPAGRPMPDRPQA